MSTMNIAGLTPVEDPSYRYKMPRVVGKVEGRGNGIKTVLMNVTDVAASLNREAPEITKFFGCELGSQTTYAADSDRAIVNGAHRDQDLQNHLSRYIENFVLCKNCRLPETHYKIKDGMISQKCLACGAKESVDMTHKLTSFILAQHKKAKEATKGEAKGDKKDKKKDKTDKGEKVEKADKPEKEKKDKKKDKADKDEEETPEQKAERKKEKARKKALKEAGAVGENVFGISADAEEEEEESDSKAADEGMERLKLFLSANPAASLEQLTDELRNIQTMASLRPADRIIIYLGAVFTEQMVPLNEVAAHAKVLRALAGSAIQQRHLIAAFEWLCGTKYPAKVKFFPILLKQLLDEELVEEDTFLAWAADFTRNEYSAEQSMVCLDTLESLKASAQPFITWLMEAEEEDGSDDEGEEGSGSGEDEEEDDEGSDEA
eukprot:CAMPEP_0184966878 /NCGR_PEP_ID=MMETSP1098-20130426/409_1 /TAXON_ID=89044 /ORGANISM="Spumella elongata, Strain CCAP 955/1" /LENGTH=433 /DNA_ID=CAMNT_0027488233 /DNA_START=240 /DNA_END=1541 /DNA_ORIENTATION=-